MEVAHQIRAWISVPWINRVKEATAFQPLAVVPIARSHALRVRGPMSEPQRHYRGLMSKPRKRRAQDRRITIGYQGRS